MNKNNNLILFLGSAILFIVFLLLSGLEFAMVLSPVSAFFNLINGSLGINLLLAIFAIIFYCVSFGLVSVYSYENPEDNHILIASAAISIILVLLKSFSIESIFFSLGLFVAYLSLLKAIKTEKDKLKKPTIFNISLKTASSALTIVNVFLALAVFVVLLGNPSYADNELSAMTSSIMGVNMSDLSEFEEQLKQQQKDAAYAQIESLETAVVYGIYTDTTGLSTTEKKKCFDAVNASMEKIDKQAKASIDMQLSKMSSGSQSGAMDSAFKLFDLFKQFYPHITAITVFMLLGMFNIFLKYIIAFSANLFSSKTTKPKDTSSKKQQLKPKPKQNTINQYPTQTNGPATNAVNNPSPNNVVNYDNNNVPTNNNDVTQLNNMASTTITTDENNLNDNNKMNTNNQEDNNYYNQYSNA